MSNDRRGHGSPVREHQLRLISPQSQSVFFENKVAVSSAWEVQSRRRRRDQRSAERKATIFSAESIDNLSRQKMRQPSASFGRPEVLVSPRVRIRPAPPGSPYLPIAFSNTRKKACLCASIRVRSGTREVTDASFPSKKVAYRYPGG